MESPPESGHGFSESGQSDHRNCSRRRCRVRTGEYGCAHREIWKRVDESLKKTGMTAYRYHSPNKLSGGQKQRVAIAGVMAMRPKCIISG